MKNEKWNCFENCGPLAKLGLSFLQAGPLLKPVLLRAMRSKFLGDKSPTTNYIRF